MTVLNNVASARAGDESKFGADQGGRGDGANLQTETPIQEKVGPVTYAYYKKVGEKYKTVRDQEKAKIRLQLAGELGVAVDESA